MFTRLTTLNAPHAALILAAMSWGVSTATTKYALQSFSATDLLVVEIGVATVWLWAMPRVRRGARAGFRPEYLLLGLIEPGLSYALFNFGLARTSGVDAAVLVSLESIALALIGAAFLGEHLTPALVSGIALAVGGAVLLAAQEGHEGASLVGNALVIAGVLAAAAYSVVARRVTPGGDAAVVTAYQLAAAFAVAVPLWTLVTIADGSTFGDASFSHWSGAVATGLLGSAVPFLLYTFAVSRLPLSRTAVASNLIPVFGVAAAVLLLGERLTETQLLGTALVVVGLGATQLDPGNG
jgi:drug/metabolite transporter (DMT)-like permease